jgi:hypothetical protein
LWVFLILSNFTITNILRLELDFTSQVSIVVTGLIFLFAAYFFSKKKDMWYLYALGTLGTVFLLLSVIQTKGEFMWISVISILIFWLANVITPFINKNICQNDLKNLAISMVTWILFISAELYNFWETAKHFPGITLGFCFMWLAIFYFILWYFMMNLLDFDLSINSVTKKEDSKNIIYSYLGISISLFSIAIFLIFSQHKDVVASIWFFESTILYFFFKRLKDIKVYLAAMVLFFIWILRYSTYIPTLEQNDFVALVPLAIVFVSYMLNLYFLKDEDETTRIWHDILHIIWLIMIAVWVGQIVPHTGQWFVFFALAIFLVIVGQFYNKVSSSLLSWAYVAFLLMYFFAHIFNVNSIFTNLEASNSTSLKSLQYIASLLIGAFLYLRNQTGGRLDSRKSILSPSYTVYIFIISSIFVYDFSGSNVFSITIFWAIWAYMYLSIWINSNVQKFRTIGLYILTLVVLKILYDIFFALENTWIKVWAFIFVGWLMIYISTMYSKKYSGNIMSEFNLTNLSWEESKQKVKQNTPKTPWNFVINEKIKDVDIKDIASVTFEVNNGKKYLVKSKNLIKIAVLVTKSFGKNEFLPGELSNFYTYVMNNYQSELSPGDFSKIVLAMKEFVEVWWSVKF